MKHRRSLLAAGFLVSLSLLAGGCIDAFGVGFADGIVSGISTVIEDLITMAVGGLAGGE